MPNLSCPTFFSFLTHPQVDVRVVRLWDDCPFILYASILPLLLIPPPHAFYFHFLQTSFSFSLPKIHKLRFPHICILMALSERRAWRSETYLLHNGMQAVLSLYITNAWGPPFSPYLCPHWPDGVCSLKSIEDDCHPPVSRSLSPSSYPTPYKLLPDFRPLVFWSR